MSLSNEQVIMTSDKDGNYTAAYTYGLDRISVDYLASDETSKRDPLYYLYDGRGSVAQLTNSLGQVKDKYSYDPFGGTNHGGPLGNSKAHFVGRIDRIKGPHEAPNPHNFDHINFTTPDGKKGTIKIQGN